MSWWTWDRSWCGICASIKTSSGQPWRWRWDVFATRNFGHQSGHLGDKVNECKGKICELEAHIEEAHRDNESTVCRLKCALFEKNATRFVTVCQTVIVFSAVDCTVHYHSTKLSHNISLSNSRPDLWRLFAFLLPQRLSMPQSDNPLNVEAKNQASEPPYSVSIYFRQIFGAIILLESPWF